MWPLGWIVPAIHIAVASLLAACATTSVRDVLPEKLSTAAQVEGMPGIRVWGDEPLATLQQFKQIEVPKLRAKYEERKRAGKPLVSNMLALSGGADDGAFGAGLLVGWGERGDRPEFDLVTGVSAGALIAPFIFIGSDYDRQLASIFTRFGSDSIYEASVLSGLLGGEALAKSDPLKQLIGHYVDAELLRRLADARSSGRILLVGTTNIDAQRPVYWDVGKIAQSGHPEALALVRSVLLASASIPGLFPPVRIKVQANGKRYEELHVDGGTTREVFFTPAEFSFKDIDKGLGKRIERRLYVIRNGKLGAEWQATEETALALGQRSLATVLKNQTIGDLIRMHAKAREDGIDYNLAAISDRFQAPRPEPFDREYMNALYTEGFRAGRLGYSWRKAPPGIAVAAN